MWVNLVDEYYDDADKPTELTRLLTFNGRLVRVAALVELAEDNDERTVVTREASATVEVLSGSAWVPLLHENPKNSGVGTPLIRLRETTERLTERAQTVVAAVFGDHDREEHRRHFMIDWTQTVSTGAFTMWVTCSVCGDQLDGVDIDASKPDWAEDAGELHLPMERVLALIDDHECDGDTANDEEG